MKLLIVIFSLVACMSSLAEEATTVQCSAVCKGQSLNLKPVTINWQSIFVIRDSSDVVKNIDAGPTKIKVTRDDDGKILLNTASGKQRFFRQTAAGISFFGLYDGAYLTKPHQTVFLQLAYQNATSIYWYLAAIKEGKTVLQRDLDNIQFLFQAFAEEDRDSTLNLQFKCHFKVH